jgi:deoxyribodipyrimidine photo-lyase
MEYVLYRARVSRRVEANRALQAAAKAANERGLPLLFYEELPCAAPYASERFHTFVLEGVPETARRLAALGIGYVFYLPRRRSEPQSVAAELAARAAAVVADDEPLGGPVPCETIDSSCIVPGSLIETRQYGAYTIRPKLRKLLPRYLKEPAPLELRKRFTVPPPPFHTAVTAGAIPSLVSTCEMDHSVPPAPQFHGGRRAAEEALQQFLSDRLRRYAREKNEPAARATSGLSPYLHYGFIGALEVALAAADYAREHKLIADEFLEELIVRRELAFNFCRYTSDVRTLAALPGWARETLEEHARDPRTHVYTAAEFEQARTHDALWNAAQKELLVTGKIHGYYRMYWGKKIIEWSATHAEALATAIHLNDRYALDGRDPNGYANILWCFGLHDRPWPERPIFGKVRWMSLEGMRRKTDVEAYIQNIEALP